MSEVAEFISTVGFPISIVVFIGAGVWYVLRRCFNAENGIVTGGVAKHMAFLDSHIESMCQQTTTMQTICDKVEQTSGVVASNSVSHDTLHRAADHACDVLDKVCDKLEIDESTHDSRTKLREELAKR